MIVKMGREPPPRRISAGLASYAGRLDRSLNHGRVQANRSRTANPSGVKVSLTRGAGDASQVVRHPAVDFLRSFDLEPGEN